MSKLLSIVIPVYKVEDYIRKCIESLIVPDKEQLELLDIVIVNDGTPDNSAVIAKEYEAKYPSIIRVIDQENRGHGGAWNHGTELAVGKFLFYLDSDDWFDTGQFSKLISKLQNTDTDFVLVNSQTYYAATNTYSPSRIINLKENEIYNLETFDWLHTPQIGNAIYITHCIFRTTLLQKHLPLYVEKVRYDDIILEGLAIIISRTFVYYDLCIYNYYKGREGQSYDPKVYAKNYRDVSTVLKATLAFLKENMPQEQTKRREFGIDLYNSFVTYHYDEISRQPKGFAKEHLKEWDEYVRSERNEVPLTKVVKMYRALPFELYIIWFKIHRFRNRAIRWIKRKLKK
ncbi:MAG: glycosyltransferase [Paludibacteraceae bacterium]|nr:glycosyltransferase [Paludibacteraceae bacterium]